MYDETERLEIDIRRSIGVTAVGAGLPPFTDQDGCPTIGLLLCGAPAMLPEGPVVEAQFVLRLETAAGLIAQLTVRAEQLGLGDALAAEIDQAKAAYRHHFAHGRRADGPIQVPDSPAGLTTDTTDTPNDLPGGE